MYKRALNTMKLRKPMNTKKAESIISTKTKRKTNRNIKTMSSTLAQENSCLSSNDSVQCLRNNENEKLMLISYQAVPISKFNR